MVYLITRLTQPDKHENIVTFHSIELCTLSKRDHLWRPDVVEYSNPCELKSCPPLDDSGLLSCACPEILSL